jgi:hypothetical protein
LGRAKIVIRARQGGAARDKVASSHVLGYSREKEKGRSPMKRSLPTRLLTALLALAVTALCLGCTQTSYDRNNPSREARQEELLRWMQTDHRN